VSGLRDFDSPSLEAVERRRLELWAAVVVALVAVATGMVLLSVLPWLSSGDFFLSPSILRVSLLLIALAFGVYAVEKELHLRRLSRMLVDERVLTAALSNRLKEISALLRAGKAINSVLELGDVLDIILSSAVELLHGENGSIMLAEDGHLRVVAVAGNERARGAVVTMGQGIAGHVASTREPLLISGTPEPGAFGGTMERTPPIHSAMSVPLLNRDDVLGVLNVNASADRTFTEYDLRALTLFAEHAAASVANARLYEAERDRVTTLLEVNEMKSEFVATVSHELRTPLTSILGGVLTLRRTDLAKEHQDALLDVIERQGQRLLRLIEQLLMAGRLERQDELSFQDRVDIAALARQVAGEFEAGGRPVEVDADESRMVTGNADALQQVLVNLLDNAHKYGKPPIRVTVEGASQRVAVLVSDLGPGIPAGERLRVFEGFTRLDGNNDTPGIGLGLSIVRRLVNACGGSVRVEDGPNGGAVFRVLLPVAVPAAVEG
jgi:K+-sensing histidine kinase KdpD